MSTHAATFYVQIEPEFRRSYYGDDNLVVTSIKAVGITQKRPTKQKPGTVLTKLTLQIPDAAFLPLRPEAIVVIPDSMTTFEPVVVEAEDAAS